MEIRLLRHLIAAIEMGTLSGAADAVFITQPALTRSLQNLEYELGTMLLERLVICYIVLHASLPMKLKK